MLKTAAPARIASVSSPCNASPWSSDAKAQPNLKSRAELLAGDATYKAQAELGPSAWTNRQSGMVSLFLMTGQAGIQLPVSKLKGSNDEKIVKLLALAKSL